MSLANLPNANEDVETLTCGRLAAISEIKTSISSTFGKMWLWNVAHPKANNMRLFEPTPISTGSSELPRKSEVLEHWVGRRGSRPELLHAMEAPTRTASSPSCRESDVTELVVTWRRIVRQQYIPAWRQNGDYNVTS